MTQYTREEVEVWLVNMSNGVLMLAEDNVGLARDALGLLDMGTEEGELPPGYLTEHFTLAEMIYSDTAKAMGVDNYPDSKATENLQRVCDVLELIRSLCGDHPVTVSSGYRCPPVNAAVGGVSDSAHVHGLAADFVIPEFGSPLDVCKAIEPHMSDFKVDQLIAEGNWCHMGLRLPPDQPRCQALTLMPDGSYASGFV